MRILAILSIFIIIYFTSCDKTDDNNPPVVTDPPITGIVTNLSNDTPIPGVKVSVLEDGPFTYTDEDGYFNFIEDEVDNIPQSEIILKNGNEQLALAFEHEDFRLKETNVQFSIEGHIVLIPKTSQSYHYDQPVQLNDGLTCGTLEENGMDSQKIQELMDKLYKGEYEEIHSLLVFRNSKLILEDYFEGNDITLSYEGSEGLKSQMSSDPIQYTRVKKHYVASVTKSFTSTLVGMALDHSGISVDSKISPYLPGYETYFADPNKAAIEFEHCLTMTAGFDWAHEIDRVQIWKSSDFTQYVLSKPNNNGPGSPFNYSNGLPNLLLKALDNIVEDDLETWVDMNFFQKLGINDYEWGKQPDGLPEGAAWLYIRPRDMVKFGATYLHGGEWQNEQVLPTTWVDDCFQPKVKANALLDYSYFFWLGEFSGHDYLSALGNGGNCINIIPDLDLVIVITQGNYDNFNLYYSQGVDIMQNYIVAAAK